MIAVRIILALYVVGVILSLGGLIYLIYRRQQKKKEENFEKRNN
ncbi:MAG: hypothetical protein ACOCX0_00830 [Bacteroidota bacterium]